MLKVDLQIQTNFSDGRDSVEEIMRMAKDANLDILSITDHDTVKGIASALASAGELGLKCIPGIELSVTEEGKLLHLLGFQIDVTNTHFLDALRVQTETRKQFFVEYIPLLNEKLVAKNLATLDKNLYQQKDETYFCGPGLVRFMKESGVISDTEQGFSLISGMPKFSFPCSVKTGIELIHKAGGLAVFSHPLAPRISLKNFSEDKAVWRNLIATYKKDGLDGVELSHTGHSEEENSLLAEWAKELDLGVTFGSDWHGTIEQTGESIKNYLPYYTSEFNGVEINQESYRKLANFLRIA